MTKPLVESPKSTIVSLGDSLKRGFVESFALLAPVGSLPAATMSSASLCLATSIAALDSLGPLMPTTSGWSGKLRLTQEGSRGLNQVLARLLRACGGDHGPAGPIYDGKERAASPGERRRPGKHKVHVFFGMTR